MEEAQGLELVARGGGIRRGHFPTADGHSDVRLDKYSGLIDPSGAQTLGRALAQRAADVGADVVIVWQDLEDVVLGFVVAGELGRSLVRAYNDDGLVGHAPELGYGRRALFVSDRLRDARAVRAVSALLEARGGTLVGVAALLNGVPLDGISTMSLFQVSPQTYPVDQCPLCQAEVPLEINSHGGGALYGVH